jgi:hypothetical protein
MFADLFLRTALLLSFTTCVEKAIDMYKSTQLCTVHESS